VTWYHVFSDLMGPERQSAAHTDHEVFFVLRPMRAALAIICLFVLSSAMSAQQDSLPVVNARIVAFVRGHMGEQVGRGECWDLAAAALNAAGAKWDGDHGFGRRVDRANERVLPGDIIQFERVEFRWEEGREVRTIRMPHHIAVVLDVEDEASGAEPRDAYLIAQQNTQETGRTTGTGHLVLSRRTKGRILFYRPAGGVSK